VRCYRERSELMMSAHCEKEDVFMQSLPPGPRELPFVGSVFAMDRDGLGFVTRMEATYGPVVTFHLLGLPLVLVSDPEAIKDVLVDHARDFTSQEFNNSLALLLGQGLLTSDGDFHRQQRRLVQPAFHRKRVESYSSIMVEYTREMVERWREGEQLDVLTAMQELTLRIVGKTLLNLDLGGERLGTVGEAFTTAIMYSSKPGLSLKMIKLDVPFLPYHQYARAERLLNETVYSIIAEHRERKEDVGDVIAMLLATQDEDGSQMTDEQIRDQVMTLFAAGHETTANLLTWAFYLLAQHGEVREKLVAEVTNVVGSDVVTEEHVRRMPYLEQVVEEVLRLYPPAWAIGRRASRDVEVGGYHFPEGTFFMMSQWVMQHAEKYFEDASAFRPERFAPENRQKIAPMTYFPFGAGTRMCIGMPFAQLEVRLLLATILSRYTLDLVPGFKVKPKGLITLRPEYGMRMVVRAVARKVGETVGV
jgi:cytochrome P450